MGPGLADLLMGPGLAIYCSDVYRCPHLPLYPAVEVLSTDVPHTHTHPASPLVGLPRRRRVPAYCRHCVHRTLPPAPGLLAPRTRLLKG